MDVHPKIQLNETRPRGCGVRKTGGLYLVSEEPAAPCGRLPMPLEICPCCGGGIKPSRGWTWIDFELLFKKQVCQSSRSASPLNCDRCAFRDAENFGRGGLIWIGMQYYPTVEAFNAEADDMGISRKIQFVPRGFKVGETYVALAHQKAISEMLRNRDTSTNIRYIPGIFRIFRPTRVEIICEGSEDDETIEGYLDRGLTPTIDILPQTELRGCEDGEESRPTPND